MRPYLGWVLGLAKSATPRTQEVAFQLAQNWIRTNFKVYSQKSAMYEKVSSWLGCAGLTRVWLKCVWHCQAKDSTARTVRPPVAILGNCRGLSSSLVHTSLFLPWLLPLIARVVGLAAVPTYNTCFCP